MTTTEIFSLVQQKLVVARDRLLAYSVKVAQTLKTTLTWLIHLLSAPIVILVVIALGVFWVVSRNKDQALTAIQGFFADAMGKSGALSQEIKDIEAEVSALVTHADQPIPQPDPVQDPNWYKDSAEQPKQPLTTEKVDGKKAGFWDEVNTPKGIKNEKTTKSFIDRKYRS